MTDENLSSEPAAMDSFAKLYSAWGHVKVAGAVVSGLAVFAMMLLIVADVVARNWLGGSISGAFEYVQNYFMPLAVFPGLAYVYGTGILPRMDLLKEKMRGKFGSGVTHAHIVLEVILFGVLFYLTLGHSIDGAQRGVAFSAGGELHAIWPVYFLAPLAMLMILIETVFVLVRNIRASGEPQLSVTAHEAEGI